MADINNYIDPKLIDQLNKITDLIIAQGQAIDSVLLPAIKKLEKVQSKLGKETKENQTERKKLTEAEKEANRIAKQLLAAETKLISLQKGQQDALIKTRTELQKNTKSTKDLQRAQQAQKGSTEQLTAVNIILEKRLRNVNQRTVEGAQKAKLLTSAIDKNNAKIKQQSSALARQKINIGNYGSAVKKLAMQFAGALGLTSAVFIFINVLKGSFNTIREFTKQNAVLAGVLGVTRKEIKELTNQAINLGSEYPVTASEVNKLQVSFARLGFTQSEIINLTEATIQGAIALNSSLDQTATLVGAVVKAYQNLGTENASEIIDKITLSTQLSSLSFSALETALPKVASAASAMNIPLSRTLTHLGIINDATLDASISGTSYRNILLELSKRGITLNEALELINNSSNKLTTSFDLFGKRGAIAGLALANAGERADEFEAAVDNAGGTAERVALEQMATLDGAIKGLDSSWEKFVLGLKESEGAFSAVVRGFSNMLDVITDKNTSFGDVILTLFGGSGAAIVRAERSARKVAFDVIEKSNEEQLNAIIDANREKADEGDKYSKQIILAAKNRIVILAKAESDAKKREVIATQDAELQKLAIAKEASDKRIEIAQKETDARVKILRDETEEFLKMSENRRKLGSKLNKENAKKESTELDEIKLSSSQSQAILDQRNLDEESAQKKANTEATKQAAINGAAELGNTLFNLKTASLQREFEAAEGNAAKQAEISRKIAEQEKKQALFNATVNIATAVVKALPNIPLSIIVGALGAVQLGVIAATPIPQFAKGTNYSPSGTALVGEDGRELIRNPRGEISLVNNPSLVNLERGSKVFTNRQTETILNDKNIVGELVRTRKAIQRMPRQRNMSAFDERNRGYRDGYHSLKNRLN